MGDAPVPPLPPAVPAVPPVRPVDRRLRPHERFHSNRDFGRVMHRQQKAAGRWLVVLVAARGRQRPARCGISVSAKAVKTAVGRHRCKRWVRECWRLHLKTVLAGQDAVVVVRSAPPLDQHPAFDQELLSLARRAVAADASPGSRGPRRGAPAKGGVPAPAKHTPGQGGTPSSSAGRPAPVQPGPAVGGKAGPRPGATPHPDGGGGRPHPGPGRD